jgi:hypothetical protein
MGNAHADHRGGGIDRPIKTSSFMPFGKDYRGGGTAGQRA